MPFHGTLFTPNHHQNGGVEFFAFVVGAATSLHCLKSPHRRFEMYHTRGCIASQQTLTRPSHVWNYNTFSKVFHKPDTRLIFTLARIPVPLEKVYLYNFTINFSLLTIEKSVEMPFESKLHMRALVECLSSYEMIRARCRNWMDVCSVHRRRRLAVFARARAPVKPRFRDICPKEIFRSFCRRRYDEHKLFNFAILLFLFE